MGRRLTYIRLSLELVLNEVALEEVYHHTRIIKEMLIMAGITLPQDKLDSLVVHYKIQKKSKI